MPLYVQLLLLHHLLTQITFKHENMEGGSLVLQFYIRNITILVHLCFIILSTVTDNLEL